MYTVQSISYSKIKVKLVLLWLEDLKKCISEEVNLIFHLSYIIEKTLLHSMNEDILNILVPYVVGNEFFWGQKLISNQAMQMKSQYFSIGMFSLFFCLQSEERPVHNSSRQKHIWVSLFVKFNKGRSFFFWFFSCHSDTVILQRFLKYNGEFLDNSIPMNSCSKRCNILRKLNDYYIVEFPLTN